MNPISAYLIRNMIPIYFFYGLAFFSLGLALLLAGRRDSQFEFVKAIPALAGFGLLHGLHEWYEMFQNLATLTRGHIPGLLEEIIRLSLLILSFAMLMVFGVLLLRSAHGQWRKTAAPVLGLVAVWALGTWIAVRVLQPTQSETIAIADVLSRYCIGVPAAVLGAWALMLQQRTFREHGMPQFGRDLVWSAAAMILYGVIGQIFVKPSPLVPSTLVNSTFFFQLFGVPVQLFRAIMATVLTVSIVGALNAFEFESKRMLEAANQARLAAQEAALESERRFGREMERLNQELLLTTQELSLVLELSNILATPMRLEDHLENVLYKTVASLSFPDAGAILLVQRRTGSISERATVGFEKPSTPQYQKAIELGQRCVDTGMVACRHLDNSIYTFRPDELAGRERCHTHSSPTITIGLPFTVSGQVIGCIVLDQTHYDPEKLLSVEEFTIMLGTAQQLGLSIENARLNQEAHEREQRLGELLKQVVDAQEAERKRIALELHDATGQSLTAMALGLRGVETVMEKSPQTALAHVQEIRTFSQAALGELRQIIADLRPSQLDDLGLAATLQWYTREFETRFGVETTLTVDGDRHRLPPQYETVLFRITQEALNNVAKHAEATEAQVHLQVANEWVTVSISDNGKGFDPEVKLRRGAPAGWGLTGIQERAYLLGGAFELESKIGVGTCIRVSVPLTREVHNVQDTPAVGG